MTFNMLANNYVLCTVVLESLIIIMFSMAVNKNLVGFGVGAGRLSTDQKKKLLWGNKKSNPPEVKFTEQSIIVYPLVSIITLCVHTILIHYDSI
jgi:hypothetical protein